MAPTSPGRCRTYRVPADWYGRAIEVLLHIDWCYTGPMPTTRPRHFVTESDELASALDVAALRWPHLSRSQLIVRLALEGRSRVEEDAEADRRARLGALHEHAGAGTGAFGTGYLDDLRADWPE